MPLRPTLRLANSSTPKWWFRSAWSSCSAPWRAKWYSAHVEGWAEVGAEVDELECWGLSRNRGVKLLKACPIDCQPGPRIASHAWIEPGIDVHYSHAQRLSPSPVGNCTGPLCRAKRRTIPPPRDRHSCRRTSHSPSIRHHMHLRIAHCPPTTQWFTGQRYPPRHRRRRTSHPRRSRSCCRGLSSTRPRMPKPASA